MEGLLSTGPTQSSFQTFTTYWVQTLQRTDEVALFLCDPLQKKKKFSFVYSQRNWKQCWARLILTSFKWHILKISLHFKGALPQNIILFSKMVK